MTSEEKSLRHDVVRHVLLHLSKHLQPPRTNDPISPVEAKTFADPLERLKQLESRLGSKENRSPDRSGAIHGGLPFSAPAGKEIHRFRPPTMGKQALESRLSREDKTPPRGKEPDDPTTSTAE